MPSPLGGAPGARRGGPGNRRRLRCPRAVVGLGGALLCKASALLAAEAVQGGGAGGGGADAAARDALREAMGALLQRVT